MTGIRQVHEYTVDHATQTAKIGGTNPKRTYISGEHAPVQVQLIEGAVHFFDQGDVEMDEADVPAYILDALVKNPLRRGSESVEQVLKFCPYCPDDQNAIGSQVYEAHLIEHLKRAGIQPAVAQPSDGISKPAEVLAAKEHGKRNAIPRAKKKG